MKSLSEIPCLVALNGAPPVFASIYTRAVKLRIVAWFLRPHLRTAANKGPQPSISSTASVKSWNQLTPAGARLRSRPTLNRAKGRPNLRPLHRDFLPDRTTDTHLVLKIP